MTRAERIEALRLAIHRAQVAYDNADDAVSACLRTNDASLAQIDAAKAVRAEMDAAVNALLWDYFDARESADGHSMRSADVVAKADAEEAA